MTIILLILLAMIMVGAVLALAVWSVLRGESRASEMLEKWLSDNNYKLLQKSTPWMKDNPFFMSSNRSQKVFKVMIHTPEGTIRQAWLRCGHALVGVAIEQVEVKWDESFKAGEPGDQVLPLP